MCIAIQAVEGADASNTAITLSALYNQGYRILQLRYSIPSSPLLDHVEIKLLYHRSVETFKNFKMNTE